jgi:phenylacetate-CoA ligase
MSPFPASEHLHTLRKIFPNATASRDELKSFQERKLSRLLGFASRSVPYWRDLLRHAGVAPDKVASVEDLSLIPISSKDDLRTHPLEHILATGCRRNRLVRHMTSGSTGKPFTVWRSVWEEHLINLFRIRAHRMAGLRVGDRTASVREKSLTGRDRGIPGQIRQISGIYREYSINALQPPAHIVEELRKLQPDVISGYASTLSHTARLLIKGKDALIRPRMVITGGEVLDPRFRSFIEKGFMAPVFDFYGAHEFNLLAWQCPEGNNYHVCDDNVIVEILRDGKPVPPGETGEVVATALHSYTMPFIRYRTGDLAVRGPEFCVCGRPFATLREIKGREIDLLYLPGNRVLHPYEIVNDRVISNGDWIFQHQLVQLAEDEVILRIATDGQPEKDKVEALHQYGSGKLGPEVRFRVLLVSDLPVEPGKKFRPYVPLTKTEGIG